MQLGDQFSASMVRVGLGNTVTPNRPGPSRVVFVSGDNVDVQHRDLITKGGNVHFLGSGHGLKALAETLDGLGDLAEGGFFQLMKLCYALSFRDEN